MKAEGTVGAPTCYNINDSVLARVWYVVLYGLVTKAEHLLNCYHIKDFIKRKELDKLGKEEEELTRCCAQRLRPHIFSEHRHKYKPLTNVNL
jgi:hypothetical protein